MGIKQQLQIKIYVSKRFFKKLTPKFLINLSTHFLSVFISVMLLVLFWIAKEGNCHPTNCHSDDPISLYTLPPLPYTTCALSPLLSWYTLSLK